MEKFLQTCFLALLCLAGSPSSAQSRVADSPGVDLLHKVSDPNRGGETLSDTFFKEETASLRASARTCPDYFGSDVSGLPSPQCQHCSAVDCGPWTVDHKHMGFSLVDTATSPGQEGGISSAQAGEGTALIYGELVNPDSLGPLKVTFRPYYLSRNSSFEEQISEVPLLEGKFFDGVVNPFSSKFQIESPPLQRPGYYSLTLDDRVLLKNYLIFPGDSLKVFVDLKNNHLVFSGPDALTAEVQYQMKRNGIQTEFGEPRKIIMHNPKGAFSEDDLRQWEMHKQAFGARLEMESLTAETLGRLLDKIAANDRETVLNETGLDHLLNRLDPARKDLILLDFYSDYFRSPVYTFFRFYFPFVTELFPEDKRDSVYARINRVMESLPTAAFSESSKLVSAEWLDLELDRLTLLSVITKEPFLSTLDRTHHGEVAERLGTAFLDQNLRRYPDPAVLLKEYGAFIHTDPWVKKLTSLKAATVPGDNLIGLQVQNLKGDTLQLESILNKPTLVYFYFSTCSHSAKYFKNLLYPFYLSKAKAMGVDLIAISVDKDRNLWRSAIGEYSDASIANYLFLPQSKEEWVSYYNISGYPRTFILSPNGKILSFGLSRESVQAFEGDFDKVFPSINTSEETDRP